MIPNQGYPPTQYPPQQQFGGSFPQQPQTFFVINIACCLNGWNESWIKEINKLTYSQTEEQKQQVFVTIQTKIGNKLSELKSIRSPSINWGDISQVNNLNFRNICKCVFSFSFLIISIDVFHYCTFKTYCI